MKSIFIQIAAYHDYELPRTINDCIKKSSGEYRLNFGINLVYYNDEIAIPNLSNIKFEKTKAPINLGVGLGRYIANSFYKDEDYYLQIDAHTRFVENWDKLIIDCFEKHQLDGYKPIITAYPANYEYIDHELKLDENLSICDIDFKRDENAKKQFKNKFFIDQHGIANKEDNIFSKSISGGSAFSSGDIALIKPNKKMFNWGEEMLSAARYFTHGYDILLPEKQYLYHLYYDNSDPIKNMRRLAGQDFPDEVGKIIKSSDNEIYRIFSNKVIGDQELGSKRTLRGYGKYTGLDFYSQNIDRMV